MKNQQTAPSAKRTLDENRDGWLADRRGLLYSILILILAIGAYFRLADLGLAAFRGDEGFFMELCQKNITPGEIFDRWMDLQALSGQFPFSAAFTKWFVQFFRLPVNHFTVHLPSALWGIATIFAAFGVGRAFAGKGFGLALALILAVNPFHIQVSREAYHYAPLVCGAFLGLWAALRMFDHSLNGKPMGRSFYAINAVGFFLLTYSQPSGWPLALLIVCTVLYGLLLQVMKSFRLPAAYGVPLLTYAIVSIPLVTSSWGLDQQLRSASPEAKANLLHIFGTGDPFLPALWRAITSYAWGDTPIRGTFTVIVLCLGLWVWIRRIKVDKRYLLVSIYLLVGFAFAIISMQSTGRPFTPRYITFLTPLLLTLLVSGLAGAADLLQLARGSLQRYGGAVTASFLGIAILLWLPPAYYCTQLTGKPTPYKLITSWVDANLPKGTLILVDRWFEPWCELTVERATNVVFTYTIPDEPVQTYIDDHWRDTATDFFARFPEAAFCEITKHYWENPNVGPWQWPREHFSHRVAFTNEAGLKLREMGQANREDYYASMTNRLIVELFYNTQEDQLSKAKAAGQRLIVRFGANGNKPLQLQWNGYLPYASLSGTGWGYTKTQDNHDWHVLEGKADIDLYNLTDHTTNAVVILMAYAESAAKQVRTSTGVAGLFPPNQPSQWKIGPLALAPGKTKLTFTDDHWALARVPLLVEGVSIEPAQ